MGSGGCRWVWATAKVDPVVRKLGQRCTGKYPVRDAARQGCDVRPEMDPRAVNITNNHLCCLFRMVGEPDTDWGRPAGTRRPPPWSTTQVGCLTCTPRNRRRDFAHQNHDLVHYAR